MNEMSYHSEIESLAREAVQEAHGQSRDLCEVIHEVVDGHSWVVWTRHNLEVLQYSANADAAEDFGGGLEDVLRSRGVPGLLGYLAAAAMIRDVEEVACTLEVETD